MSSVTICGCQLSSTLILVGLGLYCKLSILPDCKQITTNLSILSSCYKFVKIRLVATCQLQTCYNLLNKFAASLWITRYDNQLATNLLTTCNRLVINKLSQAVRTHPDIAIWITRLLQDANRLVEISAFLSVNFRFSV